MKIDHFRGEYAFLSNFWEAPVLYQDLIYGSNEAAFQAQKCRTQHEKYAFTEMRPARAKKEGRLLDLRSDWEAVKVTVMEEIVRAKFTQNEDLKWRLISTGDAYLEEGNTWHDTFWGVDAKTGEGLNHLGRILMKIREELKKEGQWEEIRPFSEGMARVKKDGKYGFINEQRKLVIPCEYTNARDFSGGFAAVAREFYASPYWDFVDQRGNSFHSGFWHWKWVWDFKDGVARVAADSQRDLDDTVWKDIYCIDTDGAYISGPWAEIGEFHEGMAWVLQRNEEDEDDAHYGHINRAGALVSPCQWDEGGNFDEGVAWVKKGDLYGAINTEGNEITPCQWDEVIIFSEGYAEVSKDGKSGCIDKFGNLVIPCEWDHVGFFTDGYCKVYKDGKCGLMDTRGKLVVSCQWDYVDDDFFEGHVLISNGDKCGMVDEIGRLIIPCEWNCIRLDFYGGRTEVIRDGKHGLVDETGRLVIPCQWKWMERWEDGKVEFGNDLERYRMDPEGNITRLPDVW